MSCPSLETVAGWALDELPQQEAEAFEEHYFGCASCFARAEGMLKVKQAVETALPPLLTPERRQALEAALPKLLAVHVKPSEKATICLGKANAVGLWVMHCALDGVSCVDLEGRGPSGELYFAFADVPFDAERGEVVMPCHVHYQALPGGDLFHARLTSREAEGSRLLGEYFLNHEFENL